MYRWKPPQQRQRCAPAGAENMGHVLVDEYQDFLPPCRTAQLAVKAGPATVRGGQSIYGWRRAIPGHTLGETAAIDFPALQVVHQLEQNYSLHQRSTCARCQQTSSAPTPMLFPARKPEPTLLELPRVLVWRQRGTRSRAHGAHRQHPRRQRPAGQPAQEFRDCLLTAPTTVPKPFEVALRKADSCCIGWHQFRLAEIKDSGAPLRLLVNNDDDPAFMRAITPKRGGLPDTGRAGHLCQPA